jgi:hypothetical protein
LILFSSGLENACDKFTIQVTSVFTHPDGALTQDLKSGILLCELVNKLSPGVVKKVSIFPSLCVLERVYSFISSFQVNRSTMPFAQRENIHAFCEAAKSLGVKDINNFTADDLFEVFDSCLIVSSIKCRVVCRASVKLYNFEGGREAEWTGGCREPVTLVRRLSFAGQEHEAGCHLYSCAWSTSSLDSGLFRLDLIIMSVLGVTP